MITCADLKQIKYLGILFRSDNEDGLFVEKIEDFTVIDEKSLAFSVKRDCISKEVLNYLITKDRHFIYAVLDDSRDLILHCRLTEMYNEPETLGFIVELDNYLEKKSFSFDPLDV
jgi:hypothetical protein